MNIGIEELVSNILKIYKKKISLEEEIKAKYLHLIPEELEELEAEKLEEIETELRQINYKLEKITQIISS